MAKLQHSESEPRAFGKNEVISPDSAKDNASTPSEGVDTSNQSREEENTSKGAFIQTQAKHSKKKDINDLEFMHKKSKQEQEQIASAVNMQKKDMGHFEFMHKKSEQEKNQAASTDNTQKKDMSNLEFMHKNSKHEKNQIAPSNNTQKIDDALVNASIHSEFLDDYESANEFAMMEESASAKRDRYTKQIGEQKKQFASHKSANVSSAESVSHAAHSTNSEFMEKKTRLDKSQIAPPDNTQKIDDALMSASINSEFLDDSESATEFAMMEESVSAKKDRYFEQQQKRPKRANSEDSKSVAHNTSAAVHRNSKVDAKISNALKNADKSWKDSFQDVNYKHNEENLSPQERGTQHLHSASSADYAEVTQGFQTFDKEEREEDKKSSVSRVVTEEGTVLYKAAKTHSNVFSTLFPNKKMLFDKNKKWFKRKIPRPIFVSLIVVCCLLFIGASLFTLNKYGDMCLHAHGSEQAVIEHENSHYNYNNNMTGIMFIGIDSSSASSENDTVQADLAVCIGMDTKTGRTRGIAIPRYAVVDITSAPDYKEGENKKAQMQDTFTLGNNREENSENTRAVFSDTLLNIPIQSYYTFDIKGIPSLNDMVGGVRLTAKEDIPSLGCVKDQEMTLHGNQALEYVQYIGDGPDAETNHLYRQLQYLKFFLKQAKTFGNGNPFVYLNIYLEANKYSTTDLDLAKILYLATAINDKTIDEIGFFMVKTVSSDSDGNKYLIENNLKEDVINVFYKLGTN